MQITRVLMAIVTLYALYKYVRTSLESFVPEDNKSNKDSNDFVRQKISTLSMESEVIKRQESKDRHLYPPNYSISSNSYENKLIDNFCTNEHTISTVQRDMFRNARFELLGVDNKMHQWNTGDFYYHHYGGLDITLINTLDSTSSKLFYYQIMRNGNINIQDHLLRFADLYPNYKACHNANYCSKVQQYDRKNIEKDTFQKIYYNEHEIKTDRHHRLPFTFIRNPLERFISGYSEIEFILKNSKAVNKDSLHLYSQIGTSLRFQDFIVNLLLSNDPEKWLNSVNIDIHYISPQIGTLLFATIKEYSHIRLYKLEDFDEEYDNLVMESGLTRLKDVYSTTRQPIHTTSDPYNTTFAAKSLLFLLNSLKNTSDEHEAKLYTRAICRIYIVDYMCLGYELPSYCSNIDDEVIELLKEDDMFHKKYNIKPFRSLADFLISVPQTAYYSIVSLFCAITSWSDPSCLHRLYYTDFYSEDEL